MHPAKLADRTARRLHGMVNSARNSHGLDSLEGRQALIEAAESHSRRQARDGHLHHRKLRHRAPSGFRGVGENCAKTSRRDSPGRVARNLFNQWMDSKGHRSNILRSSFKYSGVGVWVDGGQVYATQIFTRSAPRKRRSRRSASDISLSFPDVTRHLKGGWRTVTPPYRLRGRQVVYGLGVGIAAYSAIVLAVERAPFVVGPRSFSILTVGFFTTVAAYRISRSSRLRHILENTLYIPIGFLIIVMLNGTLREGADPASILNVWGPIAVIGWLVGFLGRTIGRR